MFIKVNPEIFEKQPNLIIGVVALEILDIVSSAEEIKVLLSDATTQQRQALTGRQIKDLPEFDIYHAAMRNFGINPSRKLMSIEALLTRISKGGDLPEISPVVDLANSISLQYHVPIGAHDIDSLSDDLEIRFVTPTDVFEDSEGLPGSEFDPQELVYASGSSIRTRRWIWRQMPAGKLAENVKKVVFPIDGFTDNLETILAARDALASNLTRFFNCNIRIGLIEKDTTACNISDFSDSDL